MWNDQKYNLFFIDFLNRLLPPWMLLQTALCCHGLVTNLKCEVTRDLAIRGSVKNNRALPHSFCIIWYTVKYLAQLLTNISCIVCAERTNVTWRHIYVTAFIVTSWQRVRSLWHAKSRSRTLRLRLDGEKHVWNSKSSWGCFRINFSCLASGIQALPKNGIWSKRIINK